MQLDLKKIPFGKRLSRHMLYEETDNLDAGWAKGLYLALAAESGTSFIGGPMLGPKGFALITPTESGKNLAYTYTASPSEVTLKTEKGSLRFAIDGTKVLRISGSGAGLRIDGRLGFGSICIQTPRGIELTMGGSIYLMTALKGAMSLDCHWDLKALHSTDPIITIEPDTSGAIDLAFYDTDDAYELPGLTDSIDRCASAAAADFDAFAGKVTKPSGHNGFFDMCVYALWTGFQVFKGKEMVPASGMADMNVYSMEQPVVTLALSDAGRAVDLILDTLSFATPLGLVPAWFAGRQNLDEAVPPVYAYAVSRMIDSGSIQRVPKEKLSALFDAMFKTVNWWLTKRTNDKTQIFYAYRHECGWPKEKIFGAGAPCASPDLQAYIILAAEALSKLAVMLGNDGAAASWGQICREQLDILTTQLWDGTGFNSLNTMTGAKAPAEGMLSLIPLILGKRLPENILAALTEKAKTLSFDELPVIPAALITLGLKASGKDTEAKAAAAVLVNSFAAGKPNTLAGAFYSPATSAALLALGGLQ